MKEQEADRRVVNNYAVPSLKFTAVKKIIFCEIAQDAG